ncbi:Replication factor C, subunit RFC4 [Yamadazyma tenuis]|uniref:HIG1 domain-containing protein n=1 Tax=Candida tenuis (strain ATCC 10573 / BCRC 21748 / CBS 615 / JCM 9827 / NBRC 10315 / NRRL Y-1498 / VKM Y-70) TaxID=590646 RepID=G3B370_CANTC|nr:uncharacterized protein CANTEDRAFT_114134 [Yamadazyma tenuis ATCC 10573]XP_006686680.1 uncharacterized protein CANTEDRAFT_114134 [Yamadazyma tenuis ATCC 10573]EGV64365.1 hypothetical protein CANTEDRAFT_114134 [Yamadazyma tenuis ATCC 10573]EGV64366.1 hypothetical protein CANTEDRAFT_114134 [Yamadazyma tenuis ATCC 10573]WEJ96271.1 Replication factor C, subunit RFC4 [Yamadazyma tenuis]
MKILGTDEREAHIAHITAEGTKGLFYGSLLSAGLFAYLRTRHPVRFSQFNTSIKTCIFAMPTIATAAFWADQGSVEFDRQMHSSDYQQEQLLEQYKEWQSMSKYDKSIHFLNDNKYKIVLSAWAASLYGSWVLVNRDKIMTTAQKAVQARMYAQGVTVLLLIGTVLLAVKEEEINKKKPAPIPEWQKVLNDRAEEEKEKKRIVAQIKKAKAEKEELSQ